MLSFLRYKRHEVQKRYAHFHISHQSVNAFNILPSLAVFYLISITASGVSPILAWALSLLDGKRNIAGWRWIFVSDDICRFLPLVSEAPSR